MTDNANKHAQSTGPNPESGSGNTTVDVRLDQASWSQHLAEETRQGLGDNPPWIPPVWFYDELGSELFDQITQLEEYYPTNAEREILQTHSKGIAELTQARRLVELGSGTSEKTGLLLDALAETGLKSFVPFDCSEEILRSAATSIATDRPNLAVHAVVGDFHEHLDELPHGKVMGNDSTLLAFLGSTIGNFEPHQRKKFLADVRSILSNKDWLLLGTDLVKSTDRLTAAYDDSLGTTAQFNLNSLNVMNAELGADFDPSQFSHTSVWNAQDSRIEMHLVSQTEQTVEIEGLDGLRITLLPGQHLRTEISTKFTEAQICSELSSAGLEPVKLFKDRSGDFLVSLSRPLQ